MISTRPYLIRAFYQWILDNEFTPYIVVNAYEEGTQVPQQYVKDGSIVFNISPTVIDKLEITNDWLTFRARFSGIPHDIYAPIQAVTAIYARENGRGAVFEEGADDGDDGNDGGGGNKSPTPDVKKPPTRGKPKLTVVK
ncbi:ClpXP protease specificity-enhancing factor [soil metagenome]